MQKKIYLVAFFLLVILKSFSQIAIYDALELAEYVNKTTSPHKFKADATSLAKVVSIIKKYYPEIATEDRDAIIISIRSSSGSKYNPILAQYLNVILPSEPDVVPAGKSLLSSLGDINVTNFADGLAKFLVERSKEELNVAFFRKFQEYLTEYPEAKILFPSTVGVINNIVAYNYTAMLPALRTNFQKDLNTFSNNILALRDVNNYTNYSTNASIRTRADAISNFFNQSLSGRSIAGALVATNGILRGDNPAEVINSMANDRASSTDDNFSNLIHFVNLISGSLRSTDEGRVWVNVEEIKNLFNDDAALHLYFGLVYAQDQHTNYFPGHNVRFTLNGGNLSLKEFLTSLHTNWSSVNGNKLKLAYKELALAANEVANNAEEIIETVNNGEKPDLLRYTDYISSLTKYLKSTFSFLKNHPGIQPGITDLESHMQPFLLVIDNILDACNDIKNKNYTSLVLHVTQIIEALPITSNDFKKDFVKYATFMANVTEAENSDEVKKAIEAAVLPVGSSSIKRETNTNIALNAFIGPFGGGEYLPKLEANKTAFVTGITAPVGVAFSWGNLSNDSSKKGGKSFSIFIPLIDVGAISTFRLSDENTKVASEIKLKNIISPGLYFYFGFGRSPISLGLGAQLGPELREVTATNINVNKNYYVRGGLNLVVDIPLLNLYTKN